MEKCMDAVVKPQEISDAMNIAKGIGIVLMVAGHTGFPWNFIGLFHMPLFFIISGYFFNATYVDDKKKFIAKRVKRLYMPFVAWNVLFLILHNILYGWGIYQDAYQRSDYGIHLLKILCFTRPEPFFHPLWFLKSLFISSCILLFVFHATKRSKHRETVRGIIFFVLLCAGWLIKWQLGHFAYDIHRELMVPSLIYLGYAVRHWHLLDKRPNWLVALLFFGALYICSKYFTFAVVDAEIVNPLVFLIVSSLGFYMVYAFSFYLLKIGLLRKLFVAIGRRTMPILILHLVAFKILHLTLVHCGMEGTAGLDVLVFGFRNYWIAYTLVGVVLPLFLYWIYKWIVGTLGNKNIIRG